MNKYIIKSLKTYYPDLAGDDIEYFDIPGISSEIVVKTKESVYKIYNIRTNKLTPCTRVEDPFSIDEKTWNIEAKHRLGLFVGMSCVQMTEVAKVAGYSRSYMYHIMDKTNDTELSYKAAVCIANYLKIEPKLIFGPFEWLHSVTN